MDLPLDHVGIAVPAIAAWLPFFEAIAGSTSSPVEPVPAQHVNVAFLGSHGTRVELIEPSSEQSTVQRFLDRRGAGLHHIAYRVSDLRGALERLSAAGYRLIDEKPRPGAGGHMVAFLHPSSTGGILVELVSEQKGEGEGEV